MNNNWLSKDGKFQIDYYLNSKDVILIEQKLCIELMVELFSMNFEKTDNLSVLDVGCGDGTVSSLFHSLFPDNTYTLLDGSKTMMEAAKQKSGDKPFIFRETTFEEYLDQHMYENSYDFIFSSMAIHHLGFTEKQRLYGKLFHELRFGGLFLNYDVVLPSSSVSEKWQFQLWTKWVDKTQKEKGRESEIGTHSDLPSKYKHNLENKPSSLHAQLEMLTIAGFRDVDSFYQYANFALFGGRKV